MTFEEFSAIPEEMSPEEALSWLEEEIKDESRWFENHTPMREHDALAVDALKYAAKAVARNIKESADVYTVMEARSYFCPNCGNALFKFDNYCRKCGQAIKK